MNLIVFIAPSKTFNKTDSLGSSEILFPNKTKMLYDKIAALSRSQLMNKMKLSEKLASEVYEYFHHERKYRALSLYSGVSYRAMETSNFTPAPNRLYILDAFYGLVRPSDNIYPYRLDFTMRFLGNLYSFWQDSIEKYLMTKHDSDIFIDLTSKEFSPLLRGLQNVIRIDFVAKRNKLSSVLLKQIRGKMTRYIFDQNIDTTDKLKQIKIEGFSFDPQSSNNHTYIFTR